MSLEIVLEVWQALRPHIAGGFQEAADDFVTVLVDNVIDLKEASAYTTDMYIKKSLSDHIEIDDYEDEDEDDMYNEYDE